MSTSLRNLRYALRQLRKNPGFTAVAVLALALGIGLSTVIFSVFYNGVLHPFPYRDPGRLTVIGLFDSAKNEEFRSVFRLDEIVAFRQANHTFEDIVGYFSWDVPYAHDGSSEPVHGCMTTPNMIDFWGMPPLIGRGLTEQDARDGANPVVILNYAFWKSHFHADKSVLGKSIVLDGKARTIISVMPKRFGLYGADLYVPIRWDRPEPTLAQAIETNDPFYFFATARIKPGVSLQTAAADIQSITNGLIATHKQDYPPKYRVSTRPMNEVIVADFKQTLVLLIAAVALLLFISSSNVASLLLTHHTARARELALRAALGASRSRLVAQLFVESLVLGLAGCLFGCVLAFFGLEVIRLTPGLQVPGEADMSLNLPALLFAVGISLFTTLLFGLSPALIAVRRDLRASLQTTSVNMSASRGGARIRAGLVIGQVALSMLLLVFAGLMMRSFLAVLNSYTGISTQRLLGADVHFPPKQYDELEKKRAFFDQALPRISAIPGVQHVAVSFGLPMEGGPMSMDITIPGKPHSEHWTTAFEGVSEDYFTTLGLQLIRGRLLTAADIAGARRVAVVNRTLVKNYFGTDDPIGRQIKFNVLDEIPKTPHDAYFEIVGVINDFRNYGIQEPIYPQAYVPYSFTGFGDRSLLVRTAVNPMSVVNNLRQAVAAVDGNVMLNHPGTIDDFLQAHVYMKPKFRVISFGTCAAIGLGLALIGLFGVMAYSVTLQTHDFGVRVALGAQSRNILGLVLRRGLWLVGSGIVIGLIAAALSVRIVKSQLWGVSAFDLRTMVIAPLALLATGLLACYIPARRAMRVDPMIALRHE